MITLTIASIIGFLICSHRYLKIPAAATPIFCIPFITLLLYFSALMQYLSLTTYFIHGLGLLLLVVGVGAYAREKIFNIQLEATEDILVLLSYVFLLIILFIGLQNTYFSSWDEFSFWGTISKAIYEANALPTQYTPIAFKDYPLAAALFHYFIYKGMGEFLESHAYFAQMTLLFSALFISVMLKPLRLGLMSLALLSFLVAIFDKQFLHSLYVDNLVAIYFACTLLAYEYLKVFKYRCLVVLPALMLLPLIKQIGFLFALLLMIIILVEETYAFVKKKDISLRNFLFKLFVIPISIYSTHLSWEIHYHKINAFKTFSTKTIDLKNLALQFSDQTNEYNKIIRHQFLHAIGWHGESLTRVHFPIPLWFSLIIFGFGMLMYHAKNHHERFELMNRYIILILGFFIYTIGLLVLYMNAFVSVEAIKLASFSRYISIYFLTLSILTTGLLIPIWKPFQKGKISFMSYAFIIIFALALLFSVRSGLAPERKKITNLAEQVLPYIKDPHATIFIINQNSLGMQHCLWMYALWPRIIKDVYPNNSEALDILLKQSDYLLLMKTNPDFWQYNNNILEGLRPSNQPRLFKVIHKDKRIHLIYLAIISDLLIDR